MKLGFISTVSGDVWAGSEELWWQVSMRALRSKIQVAAVVDSDIAGSSQIAEMCASGGNLFVRYRMSHPRLTAFREKFASPLGRLNDWKPDVVTVSMGSPLDIMFWPQLSKYLIGTTVPYTIVCQFNSESLRFSPQQRADTKRAFEKAACVVFVSTHNQELGHRQLATDDFKSVVIPNPIRVQFVNPLPIKRAADSPVRFGCVSRFDVQWKAHDVMLKNFSEPRWAERNWRLDMFGNGSDLDYVKDLVDFYGLSDRIRFMGYERDITKVWATRDICLSPSRGEGMPLAVLEAMMCGRPVVVTDVGGIDELVDNNINGFVAEAATPTSYGNAMEEAWKAKDNWGVYGFNAHESAKLIAKKDPIGTLFSLLERFGNAEN